MDRRIFFALAAIVGVCAAILFIPSRHSEDPEASSASQATEPDATASRLRTSGGRKREPLEATEREPVSLDQLPAERADARAANEARRATPFYQHAHEAGKRWLVLANTVGPAGDEELAGEMRAVSRELRKASLPSGNEQSQAAALEHESRVLARLRDVELEGEMIEAREYLEQAFSAVTSGQAPPESGSDQPAAGQLPGSTGGGAPAPIDAPVAP